MILNPLAWLTYARSRYPNFHAVVPKYIYRSASPKPEDLKLWHEEHGIETWIDLRMPANYLDDPAFFEAQIAMAAELGIERVSFPLDDFGVISDEQVRVAIELFGDETKGVQLWACAGGRHRTGAMIALFRTSFQRWAGQKAYDEAKEVGGYYSSGHGRFDRRLRQLLGLMLLLVMFTAPAFGQHPFIKPDVENRQQIAASAQGNPPEVSEDDRFNWSFWLASISYSYATAMDISTTKGAIDRGAIELNPIFGHGRGRKVRYTANAIASAGIYAVAVYAEKKGHRLFARVILITGTVIRGGAAIWNHNRRR